MTEPTPEQIEKLPKWAKEHLERITRLKERAEGMVKRFTDDQVPSPIYVDEWHQTPRIKRYVRCEYSQLVIEHAGVNARILLATKTDIQRLHGIEITFEAPAVVVPRGYNSIQLVHKDNL